MLFLKKKVKNLKTKVKGKKKRENKDNSSYINYDYIIKANITQLIYRCVNNPKGLQFKSLTLYYSKKNTITTNYI